MKVAYVLPYLQKPSGWRSHACSFIAAIRGYVEPVLYVSSADIQIARKLFPEDRIVPLPVTQDASFSNRLGSRRLLQCRRTIKKGSYPEVDLVHALEAYPTGLVGKWLARQINCPYMLTCHGTYGVLWYEKFFDRTFYRRVLRHASMVCPVSSGTADMMRQYFGSVLAQVAVRPILNGNDFYKQYSRSAAMNRECPAVPTLLTVGDVKPRKGQHLSLAAFERVKNQLPDARYHIVGSYSQNDYYLRMKRFMSEHQLGDVHFFGQVPDESLSQYYQQASVFVLTPQQEGLNFEGFGLVYLEAGAFGLPVVATRSGGVPEAVIDGETGYLAGPGDVDEVASKLLNLLTDIDLARSIGRQNRLWSESLTWERNAGEYYSAYQDVLAGL
ncbi:MAG: glycosyltransferase family 4 protein [Anaerolineales bacterium]|jgi:glycosyltransferase involved in cell wall biosynthesis